MLAEDVEFYVLSMHVYMKLRAVVQGYVQVAANKNPRPEKSAFPIKTLPQNNWRRFILRHANAIRWGKKEGRRELGLIELSTGPRRLGLFKRVSLNHFE